MGKLNILRTHSYQDTQGHTTQGLATHSRVRADVGDLEGLSEQEEGRNLGTFYSHQMHLSVTSSSEQSNTYLGLPHSPGVKMLEGRCSTLWVLKFSPPSEFEPPIAG